MEQTADAPGVANRIFISHSSHDTSAAASLVAALEAGGMPCWIAPRDVPPGHRYGEAIIDGINGCSLLVLLLSSHSNTSPQVLAEIERAVSKGRAVLTLRLEDVVLTKSLEYFLSAFHWLDAFPPLLEAHLASLVDAVRRSAGTPSRIADTSPSSKREPPNNLPHRLTSFIGREQEIATITGMLHKTRLLTLTGIGGTGKTRLSQEVAGRFLRREEVENHAPEHGIWFVEFAPLSDPLLVAQAVANILSIREEVGVPFERTLCIALKTKRLMLILDNCEHVLASCASLASQLMQACPGVQILASSREPLGVPGEQIHRVPSLSLPEPKRISMAAMLSEHEATRLFVERADAVRPDAITDMNAPVVAVLCRRLDGIPLALELAAARVRSLSVEDINTRLDNRFRLLTGGSKTLLPRQQTLKALIDWSYDLLTDQEQILLRRLSVFAGGWDLTIAESACAGEGIEDWEIMDLLTALVDKSLVVYADVGGIGRYRLLETVRAYTAERLDESGGSASARARHRDAFAALAEEAKSHLLGPDQGAWLSRLEVEHDNLREALSWCEIEVEREAAARSAETWLRLCVALRRFWDMRGYCREGRERLERALERTAGREPSSQRALALSAAGWLARGQSDFGVARSLTEAALAEARRAGDRKTAAGALNNLGVIAYEQSDLDAATAYYEESLVMFRQLEDQVNISCLLSNLGMMAFDRGDYGPARTLLDEGLVICRQLGDQSNIAASLNSLGLLARDEGDEKAARALLEESLNICRHLGEARSIAVALLSLSSIAQDQGDFPEARALLEESLSLFRQVEDLRGIGFSLGGLGGVFQEQGDGVAARRLLEESLGILRRVGDHVGAVQSLEGLAVAALSEGDALRAARLWGATESLHESIGAPVKLRSRARQNAHWEQARALLGAAAFEAAMTAGD